MEEARGAIEQALAEWNQLLEGIDTAADLAIEPQIASSEEGFRVVFQIRPGSRLWKDWAVALLSSVSHHLGRESFLGFFDVVAGRMHATSRGRLLDDGPAE